MRAQKLREEAAEKARDEYFNAIHPMTLVKQDRRMKENTNTPTPIAYDDHMDLLDDD
jgi:hypothetical protein